MSDGLRVVVNDVTDAAVATANEIGGHAEIADVSDSGQVAAMLERIEARLGPVQVLVNNAGINRDARLVDMSDEQWRRVIEINLDAAFYCMRAVTPSMVDSGWGRIVSMSSIGILGNRNTSNYAASKAGLVALTRSAALEFAASGMTVNAIAPGVMGTSMYDALPERIRERLVAKIPVKRIGRPREVAAVAAFLVSEEASYITGQTIFVDGGIGLGYV